MRAEFALGRANAAAAVEELRAILRTQPDNAVVPHSLARVCQTRGQLDAAEQTQRAVLGRQPGDATTLEQLFRLQMQPQPAAVEPLTAIVRLQLAAGHPERALSRLDAIIGSDTRSAPARNLKAEVLLTQKRYAEAAALLGDAIAIPPIWAVPYLHLASAQLAERQTEAAIATVRREPQSIVATHNLATLLANYRGDRASLERAAQLAASLKDVDDPRVLDTRGWIAFRTGEYAQAVPLLQQALQHTPDSPLLRYRLAMAQLKSGDTAGARRNLEVALKSGRAFPGADEARTTLASIRRSG